MRAPPTYRILRKITCTRAAPLRRLFMFDVATCPHHQRQCQQRWERVAAVVVSKVWSREYISYDIRERILSRFGIIVDVRFVAE